MAKVKSVQQKAKKTPAKGKQASVKKQGYVQALFSKLRSYASDIKSYLNREVSVKVYTIFTAVIAGAILLLLIH